MGVALVTGATSGIGAEFVRQLARRGDDLILVARDVPRLEAMAEELRGLGRQVELLPADLSVRDEVARVVARLEDPERPVDLLVNNAGFSVGTPLTESDVSKIDLAFEVMMRTVLVLAGAAARGMRERGQGAIINVSSTAGFITMGAYSAIKGWVTVYTEGLANELRGSGVTATALCPGWVRTEFHQRGGISATSIPGPMWLEAPPVVRSALRASARGRVIVIASVRYSVLIWFARHLPRITVRWVSRKISRSRRGEVPL